ncbi:hypothetical protein Ddye_003839 [Dipteronia dyeriana]|uniref:Uncharacterized protein n=1 Tax=Dipteronia dyeriana TaxID=168575 RepID=A0AAD9XTG1_9ROSI|nr:hypothetical protein Ddye_003839 [Dipteronia dyeriana]
MFTVSLVYLIFLYLISDPGAFNWWMLLKCRIKPVFRGLKSTKSMFGRSSHMWVKGEGILHALYFDRGTEEGTWTVVYNNRHVETETILLEKTTKQTVFSSISRRRLTGFFVSSSAEFGVHSSWT